MSELTDVVAASADAAGLHAPVPTLLLELQASLGPLGSAVADATGRGRRPFRPAADWAARLGELGYGVYLLADQTGVDLDAAIRTVAVTRQPAGDPSSPPDAPGWPLTER